MGQVGGKFNSLSMKKAIRKMFRLETRTEEGGSGDRPADHLPGSVRLQYGRCSLRNSSSSTLQSSNLRSMSGSSPTCR